MGFSDIIIKPIKKEILLEKINKNIINREDIFKKKQMIEATLLHKVIFFFFSLTKASIQKINLKKVKNILTNICSYDILVLSSKYEQKSDIRNTKIT